MRGRERASRVPGWNGEYEFAARAGDYRLFYVSSLGLMRRLADPSVREPLLRSGTVVVLAEGGRIVQNLRLAQ